MSAKALQVQLPDRLDGELAREAERTGKSLLATAVELLQEAIRMRRAPGISFADGPSGRRAVVAGSGLDVWEVVATWRELERDFERLCASYPWLTQTQLRAALAYYDLYPEEIDARLERERGWTPERVWLALPFSRPRI